MFEEFIARFQILNAHDHKNINLQAFEMNGFKYAPMEKITFLTIQYFINIIQSIDKSIKHVVLFYSGFFIYSSIQHNIALDLFNYYYGSGNPIESEKDKI